MSEKISLDSSGYTYSIEFVCAFFVFGMGGSLPLPGSRQTGWKWFLLLCGIWGVGNFCPRQCVRRCMDRLKVGEKIEKSEAPNTPMC